MIRLSQPNSAIARMTDEQLVSVVVDRATTLHTAYVYSEAEWEDLNDEFIFFMNELTQRVGFNAAYQILEDVRLVCDSNRQIIF